MRRVIVFVAAAVLLAPPAGADDVTVDDPQDSAMELDVAHVGHAHETADGRGYLIHEIATYEPWTPESFAQGILKIYLPGADAGSGFDRSLVVEKNPDGTFVARMLGRRGLRGFANVYQLDERTLRIEFPKRLLTARAISRYGYKVYVASQWECPPDVVCAPPPPDRVPNRGRIIHDL